MNGFPGIGRRIRDRLKATGYWREGRPDVARFCGDKGYRPQYLYAWLGDRVPSYENLIRLARDLDVRPEWIMFGTADRAHSQPGEPLDGPRSAPRAQIIDFARLKEVTSRLVRLEAELEAIFRAFPDFYFWVDADGTLLAAQGGRGAELHVPPGFVVGKRIADAFPADVAPALERAAREAAAAAAVVSVEFSLGVKSYETRFLALDGLAPGHPQLLMIVRDITERKQAEDAASALARVGHELAATLDPAEAAERVVSTVLGLFRVRGASLFKLDPASGALVCIAMAGHGDRDRWRGQRLRPGAGLSARAIRERRPVWSADITAEPGLDIPDWLRERIVVEGHRAVVAVPLISRGEVLGILALGSASQRIFTDSELGLLSGFADASALALQNARLYEDARLRRREAEVVAELAARISGSLDLGSVLQAVVEGARELCAGDLAMIALREAGSDTLAMRYWAGFSNPHMASFRLGPGKGIAGVVLATGRPFRTDDYAGDPRFTKDYLWSVRADNIVSAVVVPISIDRRVEGLLYVHNRSPRPFTDHDESILVRLAEHAAIAIRNARVYERSERRRRAAEVLAEVGRLIMESLDPDQVALRIAESVHALFGVRGAAIVRLESGSGDLRPVAVSGEGPPRGRGLPAGFGASGLAVRERRPVVTPDVLDDARIPTVPELRAAFELSAARAALAVPLISLGGTTGALVVRDRTGRRFDEEDVRLLQAFADHAVLALENAQRFQEIERARERTEAAATGSERRFRSLVQGLPIVIWEADAQTWQLLFVSQGAEDLFGYPLERWHTEPDFWLGHLHPDDRAWILARQDELARGDHEIEYRLIAADGRAVWLSDFVRVVRDASGAPRRLLGVMVPLPENGHAEGWCRASGGAT